MKRCLWPCVLSLCLGAALAAPIPKDKEPEPATEKQRKQAQMNLKRILLGMHNHESAFNALPADTVDQKGKPLLSWRVAVLAFMDDEEAALYKKFAHDEPWDSKTNKPLIAKMPKVFAPVRVKAEEGHTYHRGFMGNGAFFEPGKKRQVLGITDGMSNTIAFVEAGEAVVWTKPGSDIPFDPAKPLPALGKDIDGPFHAAMLDGSVKRIRRDFDAEAMKAAVTIAGGEVYDSDSLSPEKK